MPSRHVRRAMFAVGASVPLTLAALAPGLPAGASTAHSSQARATLHGSSPAWATPSARVAHVKASKQVSARVYLAPRDQAALDAAVKAVSTPGSAKYHHFITPAQYRDTYGTTAAQVAAVQKWLKGAGLKVTKVDGSRRYVEVTGSAAQAESAFGTTLNTYRHDGKTVQAPASAVSVPKDVANDVLGVDGLNTAPSHPSPASAHTNYPPPGAFKNAHPCSVYYGQVQARYKADYQTRLPKFMGSIRNYAVCGYAPIQLRYAYGVGNAVNNGNDGRGVTVAITDAYASPNAKSDANQYSTNRGEPTFAPGQYSERNASSYTHANDCGPSGWYSEETLDIEAVHGMAPGANILYYGSRSCFDSDFLDTLGRVVDDNKASFVTNSWGEADEYENSSVIHAYTVVFKQAAMQGIGVLFSSGDSGDEVQNTGLKQTDSPASNPYVTAVGGTSLAVGPNGNHEFEQGWGTDKYSLSSDGKSWDKVGYLYGAGGGFSTLFDRPDYQRGVVNSPQSGRAVPDIAMDADPNTGMLIGITQQFPNGNKYGEYRIGGTSLASPLMAGMQALASQNAGGRIGFANPQIYSMAKGSNSPYYDVVPGFHYANVRVDFANGLDSTGGLLYSVRTFDDDSTLATAKGWDPVTGVGTPTQSYVKSFGSSS